MPDLDTPIVIVVPGDLHLTERDQENVRVARWMVGEVNDLIRPDFIQFIGDNVQDATEEQFRLFDELRGRLEVPHFALVGDHDVKDDPAAARFRRRVGEPCGGFSVGGFRFLRLNTQEARPVGLSAQEAEWFHEEVDAASARGERVVVFQHNYPYQIWEDFAGPGIDEWRAVVQTRRIAAIVCGHTHYWQAANDGRNVVLAVRSIGDPEGGPPGYAIGYFLGEDLAVTYRSVEDVGPVVLVTHPRDVLFSIGPQHVVSGPDVIRARTWSASPVVKVRGRLDGGRWFPMEHTDRDDWVAPSPGDELAKGEHVIEVDASDEVDRKGRQRLSFMVDPTGRFTAVPCVRPRITQTSFS
jgi:hypothetical protein